MRSEHGIPRRGGGRRRTWAAGVLAAGLAALLLLAAGGALAGVRQVADGVEFSYYAPGAGQVFLAGSFNGWNATEIPLTNDGKGNWTVVRKLAPGKHEYKFVVDGSWFADPGNPDTVPDPYGGANSLVNIGPDGKMAAAAATEAARPISNTPLNARVYVGGRYLVRQEFVKDLEDDPRFRLLRPEQKVDLNFNTTVSELVDSYTRLRLDNTENVIQNDIAAYLDEASVDVHPASFHLLGYWNMEVLALGDPLTLGGDIDLPGTILDDHLPGGKGTAGAVIDADPAGFHFQGFFANVYDADYYNDPDLFDNTGEDRIGLRLSRRLGGFDVGLPAYLQRQLIWSDFGTLVGQEQTGIPHLDEYLARSGDPSTWFEVERRLYDYGLDLSRAFGPVLLQAEWLYGDRRTALVTGNDSGPNLENGEIDVPLLTRSRRTWHGEAHVDLGPAWNLDVEDTWTDESGAQPDETELPLLFLPESEADRRVYFVVGGSPPPARVHYSEATLDWDGGDRRHVVWLQRIDQEVDYGVVDEASPDSGATAGTTVWVLSGLQQVGDPGRGLGRWGLEHALTWADYDGADLEYHSYELILRQERNLTETLSFLLDVRWIRYDTADRTGESPVEAEQDYWAPYGGLRYRPIPRLEVVAAYGVDPLRFEIDYNGRDIGRWWFRQEYLFDHPEASLLDAEQALEDRRVFGLRAQFIF